MSHKEFGSNDHAAETPRETQTRRLDEEDVWQNKRQTKSLSGSGQRIGDIQIDQWDFNDRHLVFLRVGLASIEFKGSYEDALQGIWSGEITVESIQNKERGKK